MPNPSRTPLPVFLAHQRRSGRRPWPITLLCVAGALALVWSSWHAAGGAPARAFGPWYWAYFVATAGSLAVALWGLWQLRRWGLWAFPGALVLDVAVVAVMGELHPAVLALEVLLVATVLVNRRAFGATSNVDS